MLSFSHDKISFPMLVFGSFGFPFFFPFFGERAFYFSLSMIHSLFAFISMLVLVLFFICSCRARLIHILYLVCYLLYIHTSHRYPHCYIESSTAALFIHFPVRDGHS